MSDLSLYVLSLYIVGYQPHFTIASTTEITETDSSHNAAATYYSRLPRWRQELGHPRENIEQGGSGAIPGRWLQA